MSVADSPPCRSTNVAKREVVDALGGAVGGNHFAGTLDSFLFRYVVRPFVPAVVNRDVVWKVVPDGSPAVGTWVAGFDIIYSCQDAEFDAEHGLHSVPSVLGLRNALVVSGVLHVATMTALAALPFLTPLGWAYWVGFAVIGGVLAYEHWIVRPDDLSRIDKAFFDLNGYVSLVFLACVGLAVWL